MIAHGMDAEKYVCIPNGVVVSEWENPAPLPEIHKNFFEEHKGQFIVGYFPIKTFHMEINGFQALDFYFMST